MNTRQELRLLFGILVAMNLLIALGAIGLTSRMGPAIAEIMSKNEYSIEASEQMLLAINESAFTATPSSNPLLKKRFQRQLTKAKHNITEPKERQIIDDINAEYDAAFNGNIRKTKATVEDITQLIDLNRQAMHQADEDAQQLAIAGAWAIVLLGALSILFATIVLKLLGRRMIQPIEDLHEVTKDALSGTGFRRCEISGANRELDDIRSRTNKLLDRLPQQHQHYHHRIERKRQFNEVWQQSDTSDDPSEGP